MCWNGFYALVVCRIVAAFLIKFTQSVLLLIDENDFVTIFNLRAHSCKVCEFWNNAAKTPHINLLIILPLIKCKFRCSIPLCANICWKSSFMLLLISKIRQPLIMLLCWRDITFYVIEINYGSCHSKVTDFDVAHFINQYVWRLEITVHEIGWMQVAQGTENVVNDGKLMCFVKIFRRFNLYQSLDICLNIFRYYE